MNIGHYNHPLAKNIATIIRERGVKQYIVAKKAGFEAQEFSDMLNGRNVIKACDIPTIASALGLTPNDLYHPRDPNRAN